MKNKILLFLFFIILLVGGFAVGYYYPARNATFSGKATASYQVTKIGMANEQHDVVADEIIEDDTTEVVKKPLKVIFLIGDGMGATQIYAGLTANKALNLESFKHIGFSKTNSSDAYITDSAAGATAFSIGKKTYNGAIGVDKDKKPVKTILEMAEENGLATGLISTSSITHATPASFIAHQPSRGMEYKIATDFLNTDIDVFIGGGKQFFTGREDDRDLVKELEDKQYEVNFSLDKVTASNSSKLVGLLADKGMPTMSEGRGDMLMKSTEKALSILDQNENGFFLMVEGSQIDWGGHANNIQYVLDEMLDFDQVVGKALEFAAEDGNTLVVVTADHETGGLSLVGGDLESGEVMARFSTMKHSSVMVPVFAYGPGAEAFQGIYDNHTIFDKFMKIYGFQNTQ